MTSRVLRVAACVVAWTTIYVFEANLNELRRLDSSGVTYWTTETGGQRLRGNKMSGPHDQNQRSLKILTMHGINPNMTLGLCQGDCDVDEECEGDLICFQRVWYEPIPGCFGGELDGSKTDYCVDPMATQIPTEAPMTKDPTLSPTSAPISLPPTANPILKPTQIPSMSPITARPISAAPTTPVPTFATPVPTKSSSASPTERPTDDKLGSPSSAPVPITSVPISLEPVEITSVLTASTPVKKEPKPATFAPIPATSTPTQSTAAPISTTTAPITPTPDTSAPIPATSSPIQVTSAPIPATFSPIPATSTPIPATSTPTQSTSTPIPVTSAPSQSTSAPVSTTTAPIPATSTPMSVSSAPMTPAPITLSPSFAGTVVSESSSAQTLEITPVPSSLTFGPSASPTDDGIPTSFVADTEIGAPSDIATASPSSNMTRNPSNVPSNIFSSATDADELNYDDISGGSLIYVGNKPNTSAADSKLGLCTGDCDSDYDCAQGLMCWQRNEKENVPGCLNGGPADIRYKDYCVDEKYRGTDGDRTAFPADDVFRLKLYWELGYFWQEETFERRWCIECGDNPCHVGSEIVISECSQQLNDNLQFVDTDNGYFLIKRASENMCFQRFGNKISWELCNDLDQDQHWIAKDMEDNTVNTKVVEMFELRPRHRVGGDMCVTQSHHPRDREKLELQLCTHTRDHSDTSLWNKY